MDKMIERKKMIVAMEYIARQINDEDVFFPWIMGGVPDGDIPYGCLDIDNENIDLDFYVEHDNDFKFILSCFLRRMYFAYKSGGLYCGGVVSSDLAEDRKKCE